MVCIVDFGSSKTDRIAACVETLGYACITVEGSRPDTAAFQHAAGIILSGAPVLLTETDPAVYTKPYAFLKTLSIPVLGICFGHQLLGLLYGAAVYRGEEVRRETTIRVHDRSFLFKGFDKEVRMTEDHTEGITLPDDFICTAGSAHYATEAMRHTQRALYGVQFHPEVSGENGMLVFGNFCNLLKDRL